MNITLTPAYGRDFRGKGAAIESFLANQDWIVHEMGSRWDGKPVNISQIAPGTQVKLRYDRFRRETMITVAFPKVA